MPLSNVIIVDHGELLGLSDDDHTQYALLAGRSGGQVLYGGINANDDITIDGTSHATKTTSYVILQSSGGNVGIGTVTPITPLELSFGGVSYARISGSADGGNTKGAFYAGNTNTGFIADGGNRLVFTQSGTSAAMITTSGVHTWGNYAYRWASVSNTGGLLGSQTFDTGLSRTDASTVAVGNGTAGDYSGTLLLGAVHLGNDNAKLLFGAGQDAGSWYDGTDWIFDAQLVGTGLHRINNAIALPIVTKTANYTATKSDHTILCNASGGAFTITLPAAGTVTGIIYNIKKIDSSANKVTIDGDGAETIDGDPTAVITMQYESLMIQPDGSSWYIL